MTASPKALGGKARYFSSKYDLKGTEVYVEVRSGIIRVCKQTDDRTFVTDINLMPNNSTITLVRGRTWRIQEGGFVVVRIKTGILKTVKRGTSVADVKSLSRVSGTMKTIKIQADGDELHEWVRVLKSAQDEDTAQTVNKNRLLRTKLAEVNAALALLSGERTSLNLSDVTSRRVHCLDQDKSPTAWYALQKFGISSCANVKRVAVFGSVNVDLMATVPQLTDELINRNTRGEFLLSAGGKGANEAVAIARLGVDVTMVACVGRDEFGEMMRTRMLDDGINTQLVRWGDNDTSTGVAVIIKGKNDRQKATISCPGANSLVSPSDVTALSGIFKSEQNGVDILVVQLEVTVDAVEQAAIAAKQSNKTVVLKTAPLPKDPISKRLLDHVDIIFCNEFEAPRVIRSPMSEKLDPINSSTLCSNIGESYRIARTLLDENPGLQIAVVSSFSSHACVVRDNSMPLGVQVTVVPMMLANMVDVIGAADCFVGGFVAGRSFGLSPALSIVWAQCSACLSTMGEGAQESCPTMDNLMRFQTVFTPHLATWESLQSPEWNSPQVQTAIGAIFHRDVDGLASQLATKPELLGYTDFQGMTLLHVAVLVGCPRVVSAILLHGGDMLAKDRFGFSSLQRAVASSMLTRANGPKQEFDEMIQLMLVACILSRTPFQRASEAIIFSGREPFMANRGKYSEPEDEFLALVKGEELCQNGRIEMPFARWSTFAAKRPLFATTNWANTSWQVPGAADVASTNEPASSRLQTPSTSQLHERSIPLEMARSALVHGKQSVRRFVESMMLQETTNMEFLQYEVPSHLQSLLRSTEPRNFEGAAAMGACKKLLAWLRQHGKVQSRNEAGLCTTLHFAAMGGDMETCRQLIEWGFDITVLDHDKKSPLQYIHIEDVRRQLEREANLSDVFVTFPRDEQNKHHEFAVQLKKILESREISVALEPESDQERNSPAVIKTAMLCKVLLVLVGEPNPPTNERHIVRLQKARNEFSTPRRFLISRHINPKSNIMQMLPKDMDSEFRQQFINFGGLDDEGVNKLAEQVVVQVREEMEKGLRLAQQNVGSVQPGTLPKSSFPHTTDSPTLYAMILSSDPLDMNLDQDPAECAAKNQGGVGHRVFGHLAANKINVMLGTRAHDTTKLKSFSKSSECVVVLTVMTERDGPDGMQWLEFMITSISKKKVIVVPWANDLVVEDQLAQIFLQQHATTTSLVDWQGNVSSIAATENFAHVMTELAKQTADLGVQQIADAGNDAATLKE